MIKMIVVPLIFSTLVMGIAGTGDFKKLGRLGGKAIIWFEFATTIALAIGLLFMNIAEPGVGVTLSASAANASNAAAASQHSVDLVDYAVHIIPTNIVDAMARQDMLQIIFLPASLASLSPISAAKVKPLSISARAWLKPCSK